MLAGVPGLGLLGEGLIGISNMMAKQNDGYSDVSSDTGYSDPRDAAAKGLGMGNAGGDRAGGYGGEGHDPGEGRNYGDRGTTSSGSSGPSGGSAAGRAARDGMGFGGTGSGIGGRGDGDGGDGGYAKGGEVRGLLGPNPPGPDDGYAKLKRGEYVIRKEAAKAIGKKKLDEMNRKGK